MTNNHYHHIVFGVDAVARQRASGTYAAYGAQTEHADDGPDELDGAALKILRECFQFHLATVTETGWPYIQYRSGPRGFVHHLGGRRIAFADHHGNGQFVSVGNIAAQPRVALFVADQPLRRRVKIFGRAQVIDAADDPELIERLRRVGANRISAECERSIVIDVEALDWNCSRSIVPQYTRAQVTELTDGYVAQINELREQVAQLQALMQPSS